MWSILKLQTRRHQATSFTPSNLVISPYVGLGSAIFPQMSSFFLPGGYRPISAHDDQIVFGITGFCGCHYVCHSEAFSRRISCRLVAADRRSLACARDEKIIAQNDNYSIFILTTSHPAGVLHFDTKLKSPQDRPHHRFPGIQYPFAYRTP